MEAVNVTGMYNSFSVTGSIVAREELAVDHVETPLAFQWVFILFDGCLLH
jgi:hypothetical protein